MDLFTFILALIGSAGTAYSVLMSFYWNRVSIDYKIIEYCPTRESLIVYMSFNNLSRLPVTITNISVWNMGAMYSCTHVPTVVKTVSKKIGENQIYNEPIFSSPLPINLPSLSGTSGYVYFLFPQENFRVASKSLTVELSTNRHRTLKKILPLDESLRIVR